MNKDLRNVRLLSFVPFGLNKFHNQVDVALSHAVKASGGNALIFQCDGIYKNCEVFNRSQNPSERASKCAECQHANQSFFAEVGFSPLQLRESLEPEDFSIAQTWAHSIQRPDFFTARYENLPIGEWTVSSICTMFRVSGDEIFDEQYETAYREFLEGTLLTYLGLKRVFKVYQPTHILAFNARFSVLRVLLELAKEHNIPCLTHDKAFAEGTWNFYLNDHVVNLAKYHGFIRLWRDIPLTTAECEKVYNQFFARETGEGANILKIVNFDSRQMGIRQRLGIPERAKIVGFFTSSESEISWLPEFVDVSDQYKLLENLIEVFKNRDEYLVVRHHPLLAGKDYIFPEKGGIGRLEKILQSLPPNIITISPGDTLSTYSLLEECEAAISPASTVAIEAMVRGIPAAVLPKSYFHDVGNLLIIDDKVSYLNIVIDQLLGFEGSLPIDSIKSVYRHESIRMEKMGVRFKTATYEMKNYTPTMQCNFTSEQDIKNATDEGLEKVLDFFGHGKSFWPQPSAEEILRSDDEERRFFDVLSKNLIAEKQKKKMMPPEQSLQTPNIHIIVSSNNYSVQFPTIIQHHQGIHSIESLPPQEFFMITHPQITYDRGFVWSALDMLCLQNNQKCLGAMHGTWLRNAGGKLLDNIFTSHRRGLTDPIIPCEYSVRTTPEIMLSLALFKTEALKTVQEILTMQDPQAKLQATYSLLFNECIYRTGLTLAWYDFE